MMIKYLLENISTSNRNFEDVKARFKNTVSFPSWQQQQQLLEN
jgi:hypothetical protein